MPIAAINESIGVREAIRSFHIAGSGLEELEPAAPLRPAVLAELDSLPALEASYPLCVAPGSAPKPLAEMVGTAASAALHAAMVAATPARALLPARDAIASLVLGEASRQLPPGATLIAFHPNSLAAICAASIAAVRAPERAAFEERLRRAAASLEGLLAGDDAHRSRAAAPSQAIAALGAEAPGLFDANAIANALRHPDSHVAPMDSDRRARCESAFATLSAAIAEWTAQPLFQIFFPQGETQGTEPPGAAAFGGRFTPVDDTCADALRLCERQLRNFVPVLRAMRVARLEAEGAFDPALHPALLERFEWRTAAPEELAALPAIVALETTERLARMSLTSFSRLIRAGLPVQILVASRGFQRPDPAQNDLSGLSLDFGSLAMAHRDALVVETSMALAGHMLDGMAAAARSLRPAVLVVECPGAGVQAWRAATVAALSKTFPAYRYDPQKPLSEGRFELFEPSPAYARLLAVHAAAVSPEMQPHFRIVPDEAWSAEQMEARDYLGQYDDAPPLAIPFIEVLTESGERRRAIFTRELADFCHSRSRAWEWFAALSRLRPPADEAPRLDLARKEGAAEAIQAVLGILRQSP